MSCLLGLLNVFPLPTEIHIKDRVIVAAITIIIIKCHESVSNKELVEKKLFYSGGVLTIFIMRKSGDSSIARIIFHLMFSSYQFA